MNQPLASFGLSVAGTARRMRAIAHGVQEGSASMGMSYAAQQSVTGAGFSIQTVAREAG